MVVYEYKANTVCQWHFTELSHREATNTLLQFYHGGYQLLLEVTVDDSGGIDLPIDDAGLLKLLYNLRWWVDDGSVCHLVITEYRRNAYGNRPKVVRVKPTPLSRVEAFSENPSLTRIPCVLSLDDPDENALQAYDIGDL